MTDVLKTYPVSIPSVALAEMAERRAWKGRWDSPPDRRCGCHCCKRYFEIIDRLSRGESP